MRIVVADCAVYYTGRLNAHLPRAKRVLMLKAMYAGAADTASWYRARGLLPRPAVTEVADRQSA